jgi:type III secretory pathway component EscU
LTSENLKNTLNDSIDQLIENENINTQNETINLQESLDEVLISINSLVHDSKAIIKVCLTLLKLLTLTAYEKYFFEFNH